MDKSSNPDQGEFFRGDITHMTQKQQNYSFYFKCGDISHMKRSKEKWKMDLKKNGHAARRWFDSKSIKWLRPSEERW